MHDIAIQHREYQSLLGKLLVSDHSGGLALKDLRLSRSLDLVVAQAYLQVGHVVSAHAANKKKYNVG